MKTQHLAVALTGINLVLLVLLLCCSASPTPQGDVLRGRSLEIVDEQGRVRASIQLHPAEVFKPTGKLYPETVMFRLIDANGRPEVKLGATVHGAGLLLLGEKDDTQVKLGADHGDCSLMLQNQERKQQLLKP
jgi:hypothetical protein